MIHKFTPEKMNLNEIKLSEKCYINVYLSLMRYLFIDFYFFSFVTTILLYLIGSIYLLFLSSLSLS